MTTIINSVITPIYPIVIEESEAICGLFFITGQLNGLGGLNKPFRQILKSAAGYYIGYLSKADWSEEEFWEPYSRDSQEYWNTREEAEEALILGNYSVKF